MAPYQAGSQVQWQGGHKAHNHDGIDNGKNDGRNDRVEFEKENNNDLALPFLPLCDSNAETSRTSAGSNRTSLSPPSFRALDFVTYPTFPWI
jgi:hypothetical protein